MDNEEDFAKDTKLCAAILTGPQDTEDGSEVCILPSGEGIFYQVVPFHQEKWNIRRRVTEILWWTKWTASGL